MRTLAIKEGYLLVEYSEPYQLDPCITLIKEIGEICRREGLPKVLCDVRGMMGKINILDSFQLAVTGAGAFRGLQLAGVYRQEDIDPFAETVIRNRGGNVRVFSDIERAKEWLRVE
jgi:hypothetical protein